MKRLMLLIAATALALAVSAGLATAADRAPAANEGSNQSIAEIAAGAQKYSTLVSLLQAADLVDTLAADGSFTVFAPSNKAFRQVPPAILDALANDADLLTQTLTFHVVADEIRRKPARAAAKAGARVETVQGQKIDLSFLNRKQGDMRRGIYLEDNARVAGKQIIASNGVIHPIDQVIVPPAVLKALTQQGVI